MPHQGGPLTRRLRNVPYRSLGDGAAAAGTGQPRWRRTAGVRGTRSRPGPAQAGPEPAQEPGRGCCRGRGSRQGPEGGPEPKGSADKGETRRGKGSAASLLPPAAAIRAPASASGRAPVSCSSVKWDNLTPPAGAARTAQSKTSTLVICPAVLAPDPSVPPARPPCLHARGSAQPPAASSGTAFPGPWGPCCTCLRQP